MNGIERIAAERHRQVYAEGYTAGHDDRHKGGDLAIAASELTMCIDGDVRGLPDRWGLVRKHQRDRIRQLEIAGALIAAEIDRLLRLQKDSKDM